MLTKLFTIFGLFLSGGLLVAILHPHSATSCASKKEDPRPTPPKEVVIELRGKLCHADRAYFNDTRKCYELYSKGPCEELMVLKPVPGTAFGRCECQKFHIYCDGRSARPTVYWPDKSRCYFIYDQGPCTKGQWLVPRKDAGSKCDTIPCPEEYNAQPVSLDGNSAYLFPYEDKCYTTGTTGKGPCGENYVAHIDEYKHECRWSTSCSFSGATYEINDCGDGTWPDLNGGCEPLTVL